MTGEGAYPCEKCGAEVKVIKKPVQDPKCPTLLCCGKLMPAKDAVGVTTEENVNDIVKGPGLAQAPR